MWPSSHKDGSCYCFYHVMFEAVDAVGVVKFYQADLLLDDVTQGMWLTEFHVFQDNTGYPSRLYHYLGTFLTLHFRSPACCFDLIYDGIIFLS